MRKILRHSGLALILAAAAFAPWHSASADVLLNENFDYSTGDLYPQGGWCKYGTNQTTAPIQVAEGSLTYDGYINQVEGNKAIMKGDKSGQKLWHPFINDAKVADGTVYVSFLLNLSEVPSGEGYSFALFAETKKGIGDGDNTGTDVGKIFFKPGADDAHFQLGVSRNGGTGKNVYSPEEYEVGKTYLLVLSYTFVEGVTNDDVSLWVNPPTNLLMAPQATISHDQSIESTRSEASTTYGGLKGFLLRQSGTTSVTAPTMTVDALRAATTWAELFPEQGSQEDTPKLTIASAATRPGNYFPGMTMTAQNFVAGENLTGPVTVTCSEGVTADKTTISAEEAMSGEPVEVNFTYVAPQTAGDFSYIVTFSSEGAEDVTFNINGSVLDIPTVPNAAQIPNLIDQEGQMFRYTGKAVVTYIDQTEEWGMTVFHIYAQDMFGGLKFSTSYTGLEACPIAVGNEITDIIFDIESVLGAYTLNVYPMSADGSFCNVTAVGKTKTPAETTIAQMDKAALPSALYKLYTIGNVHFKDASGNFDASKSYTVTDGTDEAKVKIFASSDLNGSEIPTGNFALTGISTSPGTFILMPRYKADFVVGEPSVAITPEKVFDFSNDAAPINSDTEIMKYTVSAENLPVAVPVVMTGLDAAMFHAEPNKIPAGTATTVVTVYYHPTFPGKHSGGLLFDFDAVNPEFNYSSQFANCKAYDPENLPSVTIEPSIIELETTPGTPVTATATLNAANAFDFITASRSDTADNGGITINNTYLPADSQGVTLTVTFTPKTEGEYTETWTYTTTKCSTPATLTVKAKCTGSAPEEPVEGDEDININWTDAASYYVQDFSSVEHNKPLKLEGWSNVAVEGSRAWWGYTGANGDDFFAAKVTAYDSNIKPGQGKECAMVLVSPALDYKNAEEKKLKFRLMGMYLNEDSGDELTIQFGEQVNGKTEFYDLEGFSVPATADEAGEWIEYDVDMSVIEDMPDTFVIGFAFSGTRGADNSTTYYITDFQWGGKPGSINSILMGGEGLTPDADGYYNVYNAAGMRVLRTRDAADLQTLAPGLYITAGRKFIRK